MPAFYLCYAVYKLFINYPTVVLLKKHGARFGLTCGFMAGSLQLLSILGFAAAHTTVLLIVGALAMAATNAFLWNSQHLFISQTMDDTTKSSSLATISIAGQISSVVAPLIGGLVGSYFGPQYLLGLAVALCLIALLPLRLMPKLDNTQTTDDIAYDFSGAPVKDIIANFAYNVETAVSVTVWPIYLALFIANYKGIGAITTLAALAAIVVTWVAGRRGDRGHDRVVLAEGVMATSVVDLLRIAVSSQLWITLITSAYRASLAYFQNAWTSIYYHHAKRGGLQYIMSMEIAGDLAYVLVWGTALATLLASGSTKVLFTVAFLLAAICAWGCLLITKQCGRT